MRLALTGLTVMCLTATVVRAERVLTQADLNDRVKGSWFGALVANYAGRPLEGFYTTREAAPEEAFAWVIKTSPSDPWRADDDLNFEYLDLVGFEAHGLTPSPAQIRDLWNQHVSFSGVFIANLQAKFLMGYGLYPPETGSYRSNMHAYAIDAQITADGLGALSPGLRQGAIELARRFGGVSNEGYSLHAAEYYAAMYSAAAFESDVGAMVAKGQEVVPATSRTWRVVQDVRDLYAIDMLDALPDWRQTRRVLYDNYVGVNSHGRHRLWIESTINVALTTMALLYGQGDFEQSVRIAVLSGFDADCNAGTTGGILGMRSGFAALPAGLTGPATDRFLLPDLVNLPTDQTISGIANRLHAIAGQSLISSGATFDGNAYHLTDADPVVTDAPLPDPAGPTGLVRAVLDAGGAVTTSASVEAHVPALDRSNLDGIIDGVVDLRHNGWVPYWTCDGPNAPPAGGDFYQLSFSEQVRFDSLLFYEGDLIWGGINADARTTPPYGGYFEDLTVEIRSEGVWSTAANVTQSEPLDRYAFFQTIEFTFDPVRGDAIRIRGTPGGTWACTTIVELTVGGARLGDMDGNGRIDVDDVELFVGVVLGLSTAGADVLVADVNANNRVDAADVVRFTALLGATAAQ